MYRYALQLNIIYSYDIINYVIVKKKVTIKILIIDKYHTLTYKLANNLLNISNRYNLILLFTYLLLIS